MSADSPWHATSPKLDASHPGDKHLKKGLEYHNFRWESHSSKEVNIYIYIYIS